MLYSKKHTTFNKLKSYCLRGLLFFCAAITLAAIAFLIIYIMVKGLPHIKPSLFAWNYNTENLSLMPAAISTLIMATLALLLAGPLGVFCAIYLCEYSKQNSLPVRIIRLTTQTLSGIPSIIYGLFGFLFFVTSLKWGYSILAGSFTVAIMILPLIIRTTEEAINSVPNSFREGSFALGAGKLRTIFRLVLPSASPGIFAGIVLALGRVLGESAALLYSSGTVAQVPTSLFSSARTLAVHMYALSSEGLYSDQAYATAVVLLFLVVGINTLASLLSKKLS